MSSDRTLVTVSAGLSVPSSTRLLADRLTEATVEALETAGHTVTVKAIELRGHAHAIVDAMLTGFPTGDLSAALDTLYAADGAIAVTPLFTTTYSGLFKSFVDILDKDALRGLPVLLGATGGTARHSLALDYSLRPLFTYLHADVLPMAVFAATDDWAGAGDQVNPLPARITRAGADLAARIAAREPATPADPFGSTPSFADLLARGGHSA
ncbi:NADPH-dependent FMN reductase [Xylanimonas allomyrinae]|uniref:NADPH-dependent FMN reductase n=1 Tax=Xylanimonas allomyrinae TaxID=2509459 RepID=A0A4V0YE19_9MICO|nr:FMN reductase [Xylanimonas allomyrinae]QAY62671.1 NADPH-dependent FMN reductase [Xylanimonas allomyrinae]